MPHLLVTRFIGRAAPAATRAAAAELTWINSTHVPNTTSVTNCVGSPTSLPSSRHHVPARAFATSRHHGKKGSGGGARGTRSRGWLTKYREGRGGRHLQGDLPGASELERKRELNDFVFSLNAKGLPPRDGQAEPAATEPPPAGLPTGAYLDISIDGSEPRRVSLELASAVLPHTVGNFLALCGGAAGRTEELGYRAAKVSRVEKDVGICIADAAHALSCAPDFAEVQPNGRTFRDEGFYLTHSAPGMVSMISPGVHRNDSRFIITTNVGKHLDGKYVAFGRVVEGMDVVMEIGTKVFTKRGVPSKDVVVVNCGSL